MRGSFHVGTKVEFRGVDNDRHIHGDDPRGILFVFNKYTVTEVTPRPWADFISLQGVDGVFDTAWFEVIESPFDNQDQPSEPKIWQRWAGVQKSVVNTLSGIRAEVDTLIENFGTNFDELISSGKLTVDDIKNRIPDTKEAFQEFTEVFEKLKADAIEVMTFYSLDDKKRLEMETKAELDAAIEIARKYNERVEVLRKDLETVCTCTDTRIERDYVEGGYLDREQYIKREVCNVCGRTVKEHRTEGGFG